MVCLCYNFMVTEAKVLDFYIITLRPVKYEKLAYFDFLDFKSVKREEVRRYNII